MNHTMTRMYLFCTYGVRMDKRQMAEAMGVSVSTIMNKSAAGSLGFPTYVETGQLWCSTESFADYMIGLHEAAEAKVRAEGTKARPAMRRRQAAGAAANA
jgi:hypothetical protein